MYLGVSMQTPPKELGTFASETVFLGTSDNCIPSVFWRLFKAGLKAIVETRHGMELSRSLCPVLGQQFSWFAYCVLGCHWLGELGL